MPWKSFKIHDFTVGDFNKKNPKKSLKLQVFSLEFFESNIPRILEKNLIIFVLAFSAE